MSRTINQSMTASDWLMLLSLSVLWGGSFFFIGVAVPSLPPVTIVFFRVFVAALTLWLIIFAFSIPRPNGFTEWRALFFMGLLNNVIPFLLIVWGQTQIESGLASIFNAMTPMATVLIAGLLLVDEKITPLRLLGVALGLLGAIVMIGPTALGGFDSHVLAQFSVLMAAVTYGFAAVYGRRFKQMGLHPIATAAGQVTMSALVLAPVVLLVDQPTMQQEPTAMVWLAMIILSVFCTALAYILYFRILATSGATNLSLVTLLIPVSAVFLGYLFLDERLEITHFIGMLFIAAGLSAIDGRLWQRARSADP